MDKFEHYFRNVKYLEKIDIYRILELYTTGSPVFDHVIKKLLAAGQRGSKDQATDVREAITSLQRWLEMRDEDIYSNYMSGIEPIKPKTIKEQYRDCYDENNNNLGTDL